MSGECDSCGEHACECQCNSIQEKAAYIKDRQVIEWISVKEKMPNQMQDVLVIRSNNEMQVAHWAPEVPPTPEWKVHSLTEDGWNSFDLKYVTHWMPLPDLP